MSDEQNQPYLHVTRRDGVVEEIDKVVPNPGVRSITIGGVELEIHDFKWHHPVYRKVDEKKNKRRI